jgi:hypothetical protein
MAHAIYEAAAKIPTQFPTDAEWLEEREHDLTHTRNFTVRELRFAYECVRNPDNFKGAFSTTISPDLLKVTSEAVRYFTNTDLEVLGADHFTKRLLIRSRGQS